MLKEKFQSLSEIKVRYAETDQMGVVYHGNYAQYFEVGRTDWLRQFGFTYKQMEKNGIMLPVVSLTINYKKPAYYDQLLRITTYVAKLPKASIHFEYEIHNPNQQLLTTGSSVLVFINKKTNRPTPCPNYLIELLKG